MTEDNAAGYFRLGPLADMYRLAIGIFLTGTRDVSSSPFVIIQDECRRLAEADSVMFARLGSGSPLNTARVTMERFINLLPAAGYRLYFEVGDPAEATRRLAAFQDGAALCAPPGSGAAKGAAFRNAMSRHLARFEGKLPALMYVFSPLPPEAVTSTGLVQLAQACFRPGCDAPECMRAIEDLEAVISTRLIPLRSANLATAVAKKDWVLQTFRDELTSSGGGGSAAGAGGAGGGSSGTVMSARRGGRLSDALSTASARDVIDTVRAELGTAAPSPLKVSATLAGSDILIVMKFGLGFKVTLDWPVYSDVFTSAAPHVSNWVLNLSTRLAARDDGTLRDAARAYRVDETVAVDIRARRFGSFSFLGLAYQTRGLREGAHYSPLAPDVEWTELEHYLTALELTKRIEAALSIDSERPNTLTQAIRRAKGFFSSHCNIAASREAMIYKLTGRAAPGYPVGPDGAQPGFFERVFATTEEVWADCFTTTEPVHPLPATLVPRSSDAYNWSMLMVAERHQETLAAMVEAVPRFAAAAGLSVSNIAYPAGMQPSSASSRSRGMMEGPPAGARSRSASPLRSQSPTRGRGSSSGSGSLDPHRDLGTQSWRSFVPPLLQPRATAATASCHSLARGCSQAPR